MSGPKDYYPSTEAAFMAGQNNGMELAKQAAKEEEGQRHEDDASGDSKLTMEEIQGMSQEEHIARKDEVDAALEEMGK